MRVIAGSAGSLPLRTPKGMDTRPTTDRIKETLFNILTPYLPDAVFVDMFAGSGGIGIEALSRGARKAYFIENAPGAISCIQENLVFTKFSNHAIVIKQDACLGLSGICEDKIDIVFLDPPYGKGHERRVLETLKEMPSVGRDTLIVVEASKETDFSYLPSLGFREVRRKVYKTNQHIFIRRG